MLYMDMFLLIQHATHAPSYILSLDSFSWESLAVHCSVVAPTRDIFAGYYFIFPCLLVNANPGSFSPAISSERSL